ncbi:heterokaryon incompatibility protein-domain-containing protein [Staphylotrichum tortipilum]|uniref:Heterokaryon incompatibility protein-domain-containing protein n=1 Tax=Staphylotrichum tortipilum TaxID=2831512 RepID=A0AAN6MJ02_9PEZI|nr:heterokaryon incompatibility protein-domain-containing protein [Staphylotrichum longicolle]
MPVDPCLGIIAGGDENSEFWFPKTPQLNLGTRQALDDIRDKLDLCRRTHDTCRVTSAAQQQEAVARPKRLLEIDTARGQCRVISAAGSDTEYAALSYCWGTSQSMLTSNNLANLRSGVHPDFFSQTLQDAIKVVLGCNLSHLWVDAICIVQDDPQELAEEIQNMGDIYSGASFTIGAANSATSKQGFLRGTPRVAYPITLSNHDKTETLLIMSPHPDIFGTDADHPLHSRGWALQESYFSREYVHFGPHSVAVSCATTTTDSCGIVWGFDPVSSYSHPSDRFTYHREASPKDWGKMITAYSSRELTVPSDKLVAISAVVKDMARKLRYPRPENYLAGLWRQNLASWLLWEIQVLPRPHPARYRAPSWSWASVDGKVQVVWETSPELEIIDAKTSWTGPFSAVTGGFVVVRGLMMAVSDYTMTEDGKFRLLGLFGRLDAAEPELLANSAQRPQLWLLRGHEKFIREDEIRAYGATEDYIRGFALVLLENAGGQSYRRIGSFSYSEHVWWGWSAKRTVRIE